MMGACEFQENTMGESRFPGGAATEERYNFLLRTLHEHKFILKRADLSPPSSKWRGYRLLLQRNGRSFGAVVHFGNERIDRLVPRLALSVLEAQNYVKELALEAEPMAIVLLDTISRPVFEITNEVVDQLAPECSVTIIGLDGSVSIDVPGYEFTDKIAEERGGRAITSTSTAVNLFSDANQWMLKMLFAELLPPDLINAPQTRYRSGRQLGDAAGVSHVSSNKFLALLKKEGFLDTSADHLRLMNHKQLLLRWREAANNSKQEVPAHFMFPAVAVSTLDKLLIKNKGDVCLGLFAAADMLKMGHVSGVAPYLYVPKLMQVTLGSGTWSGVMPSLLGERTDLYIRQATFPTSIFKAMVVRDNKACTDVIQTWLDVSYHPARGQEQANLIYDKFLRPIVEGNLNE